MKVGRSVMGAVLLGAISVIGVAEALATQGGCPLATDISKEQIAFVSERDGDHDIYLMNGDGRNLRQLTDHPGIDAGIDWSPDGRRLAFASDRDGNPELYVMNADGTGLRRLTNHPSQDASPSWSPDGQIAFHSNRTGDYDIYALDPEDPALAVRNLTNRPRGLQDISIRSGDDVKPTWSPDGSTIAFESYRDAGRANPDIWIMNADGSDVRRLAGAPDAPEWFPAWSPDGSAVAFMTARDRNWDTYIVDTAGNERPLLKTPKSEYLPGWSANSKVVYFGSNLADGGGDFHVNPGGVFVQFGIPGYVTFEHRFDLYATNADGSCLTRITTGGREGNPKPRPRT